MVKLLWVQYNFFTIFCMLKPLWNFKRPTLDLDPFTYFRTAYFDLVFYFRLEGRIRFPVQSSTINI